MIILSLLEKLSELRGDCHHECSAALMSAVGAEAADDEVARCGGEVVVAVESLDEAAQVAIRELDERAAVVAHGVVVAVAGEVVRGGGGAGVDLGDEAGVFEELEGPVDGGEVHVGVLRVDSFDELVRGQVVGVVGEQFGDDGPAGGRDAFAPGSELIEEVVDGGRVHHR